MKVVVGVVIRLKAFCLERGGGGGFWGFFGGGGGGGGGGGFIGLFRREGLMGWRGWIF